MKKIMFCDEYGLTQAVLNGKKTMTRRIITKNLEDWLRMQYGEEYERWIRNSQFQYLEEVAIAQSYKTIHEEMMNGDFGDGIYDAFRNAMVANTRGWNNKMFVQASLMPHHIRITDIKVQRLHDINGYECIQEGIERVQCGSGYRGSSQEPIVIPENFRVPNTKDRYIFVADAFKALIEGINGKGTWNRNPYVFAYTFELVKGADQ